MIALKGKVWFRGMQSKTVYLKCDRNVEVKVQDVFLKDVAAIRCSDDMVTARLKALKVHHFK